MLHPIRINIAKVSLFGCLIYLVMIASFTAAWALPISPARPDAGEPSNYHYFLTGAGRLMQGGAPPGQGGQGGEPQNGKWPMVTGKTWADVAGPGWYDKKNGIQNSDIQLPPLTQSDFENLKKIVTKDSPFPLTGPNAVKALALARLLGTAMDNDPARSMHEAQAQGQAQATQAGDAAADAARGQAASAIGFCASYLENFTTQPQWNLVRDQIFVPMAILLLLPGAALAQMRAIIAAGSPVLGEVNPFEGILRSIVAIFLIPGTALVVNYGIDLNNSIAYTINSEYFRIFASDMYKDALCAEMRATPVRQSQSNRNALDLPAYVGKPLLGAKTAFGMFEGMMMENSLQDPCAGINLAPQGAANEAMSSGSVATRAMMNGSNASLAAAWNILCAFQLAYLYYLWCVGPIMAALWVYPLRTLRNALPSWVEGVVTLCFWSLFWNTVILLMACFKGVDETGTMIMTALNFLATASVKYAFDFAGLVKAAGQEAAGMAAGAAQQAAQSGGGGAGKSGSASRSAGASQKSAGGQHATQSLAGSPRGSGSGKNGHGNGYGNGQGKEAGMLADGGGRGGTTSGADGGNDGGLPQGGWHGQMGAMAGIFAACGFNPNKGSQPVNHVDPPWAQKTKDDLLAVNPQSPGNCPINDLNADDSTDFNAPSVGASSDNQGLVQQLATELQVAEAAVAAAVDSVGAVACYFADGTLITGGGIAGNAGDGGVNGLNGGTHHGSVHGGDPAKGIGLGTIVASIDARGVTPDGPPPGGSNESPVGVPRIPDLDSNPESKSFVSLPLPAGHGSGDYRLPDGSVHIGPPPRAFADFDSKAINTPSLNKSFTDTTNTSAQYSLLSPADNTVLGNFNNLTSLNEPGIAPTPLAEALTFNSGIDLNSSIIDGAFNGTQPFEAWLRNDTSGAAVLGGGDLVTFHPPGAANIDLSQVNNGDVNFNNPGVFTFNNTGGDVTTNFSDISQNAPLNPLGGMQVTDSGLTPVGNGTAIFSSAPALDAPIGPLPNTSVFGNNGQVDASTVVSSEGTGTQTSSSEYPTAYFSSNQPITTADATPNAQVGSWNQVCQGSFDTTFNSSNNTSFQPGDSLTPTRAVEFQLGNGNDNGSFLNRSSSNSTAENAWTTFAPTANSVISDYSQNVQQHAPSYNVEGHSTENQSSYMSASNTVQADSYLAYSQPAQQQPAPTPVTSAGEARYAAYTTGGAAADANWQTSYSVPPTTYQTPDNYSTQSYSYNSQDYNAPAQSLAPTYQVADAGGHSYVQGGSSEGATTGFGSTEKHSVTDSWFAPSPASAEVAYNNAAPTPAPANDHRSVEVIGHSDLGIAMPIIARNLVAQAAPQAAPANVAYEPPKPLSMRATRGPSRLTAAMGSATGNNLPPALSNAGSGTRVTSDPGINGSVPARTTGGAAAEYARYQPQAPNGDEPPPALASMPDSLQTALMLGNQRGGRIQKSDDDPTMKLRLDQMTGVDSGDLV